MHWHKSTCPYCGLGCGLEVGVDAGQVTKVRGMKGHPTNHGDLCALAANLPPVFTGEGRLRALVSLAPFPRSRVTAP